MSEYKRTGRKKEIMEAGFDIKENAEKLQHFYLTEGKKHE